MWPKFGNSISMRGVILKLSLIVIQFDQRNRVLKGWSWFKFNSLGLVLGMALKIYSNVAKGLELKVSKFLGLMSTFGAVTGERLLGVGGRGFFLNRVKA